MKKRGDLSEKFIEEYLNTFSPATPTLRPDDKNLHASQQLIS